MVMSSGSWVVCWTTIAWAMLLAVLCIRENHQFLYDDVFITLRYALHLAQGHGPIWNLNEAPVEGFTSPLHLLLVAALGKIGLPLVYAARAVGFCSHLLLVAFLWRFVARSDGPVSATLVAALVATSWPLLVWDLGGLDAVLFAAILTAGTLVTLRNIETGSRSDLLWGGALFGLAVFARPDGALVAAVAILACVALGRPPMRERLVHASLAVAICALVALPWEIFRLAYYHSLLPNTYYAKVYGVPLGFRVISGIQYWRIYARNAPYLALMVFIVAIAAIAKRRIARFDLGLGACLLAYALYVLDCGGDHMVAFRFMVPMIPLLAVALVRGIRELGGLRTTYSAVAVTIVLALVSARQIAPSVENPLVRDGAGLIGEQIGRYINLHWAPGSVVGTNVAGTTAYFADQLTFIDMLGLNDRTIAKKTPVLLDLPTNKTIGHLKADGDYVLARRPGYIILSGGNTPGQNRGVPGYLISDYEVLNSPEFAENYRACEVALPMSDDVDRQLPWYVFRPGSKQLGFFYYQRRDLPGICTTPR
jgi:hypothetical protein